MRCLFVTHPGEGHLNPMLPVARHLAAAGHQVAFAVAERFRPLVRDAGFESFAAGMDWLESEKSEAFGNARELGSRLLTEVFADVAIHHMVPDLLELVKTWKPDILVRNDYEFATCIVSEITEVPQISVGLSFTWRKEHLAPQIEEGLAFARSAYQLEPYPAMEMLYPYLRLSYVPADWQPVALDLMHAIRPEPIVVEVDQSLRSLRSRYPNRRTIYASMGTVNNLLPDLFPTILQALRDEPITLVLTVGRNQDPLRWGPQPDNVLIERYVRQDALLPMCDLMITSASFFTVVSSLRHGVPVLMTPITGDEPAQAHRFSELGLGRVLRRPGPVELPLSGDVEVFGVESLRAAALQMLQDAGLRNRVDEARRDLDALPSAHEIVPLLEQLAENRRPPVRGGVPNRSLQ